MIQTVIRSIPFRIIKNGKPGKAIGKRCCRQWLPVSRLNHVIGNADTTARTAFLFLTVFHSAFPHIGKLLKQKEAWNSPEASMLKQPQFLINNQKWPKAAERKLERQPEVIESKYKSNMQRRPWEKSQAFFFIEASIKALSQQRPQITAAR